MNCNTVKDKKIRDESRVLIFKSPSSASDTEKDGITDQQREKIKELLLMFGEAVNK